jgi:uncharacterized protein (DUF983 family)
MAELETHTVTVTPGLEVLKVDCPTCGGSYAVVCLGGQVGYMRRCAVCGERVSMVRVATTPVAAK